MSHNEVYTQVNVPFSWEIKPGVSKVTHEEGNIDIIHVAVNLPPPPRLSKSARFRVADLNGVLPQCQLQPPPSSSEKKANATNNKMQDDPFVAAFRKCTEYSMNGKFGTDDKNDASRTRTKKSMFTLSCKCSCNIGSGKVKSLSALEGRTERKRQG